MKIIEDFKVAYKNFLDIDDDYDPSYTKAKLLYFKILDDKIISLEELRAITKQLCDEHHAIS